ncbi:hypothetical protein NX059_000880 [Plenodomus lindquistii]|nr:hypothetical protein NX059_000880 [Plenodomus lindquistii]
MALISRGPSYALIKAAQALCPTATVLLVFLPPPLIFLLFNGRHLEYTGPHMMDWTPSDQAYWNTTRAKYPGQLPGYIVKDTIETPRPLVWLLCLMCGMLVSLFAKCRHNAASKNLWFWNIFATMMAVRTHGVFSGSMHLDPGFWYFSWPASSASPYKGLFLYFVVERWGFWDKTSLGRVEEPEAHHGVDVEKSGTAGDGVSMEEQKSVGWRDAALRLAYVHVVDSIVHVVWLRYFWKFGEGDPYTRYVNNSEIWTVVLVVEMLGYVAWRLLSCKSIACALA